MESFVELIEEWFGRRWATLAAIVAILIPIGLLCLIGAGIIDPGIFSHFG